MTATAAGALAWSASGQGRRVRSSVVPQPAGSISVTSYGADPSGKADATTAFARAIDAAEKRGDGTLYVPPGRYVLDDPKAAVCELCIRRPIRLVGAGASAVTLVNEIGLRNPRAGKILDTIEIFSGPNGAPGGADGTTVSGLTLDSATYEAGTDIMDFGNHTTLRHLAVHAAASTDHLDPSSFGIRVIAVCTPYDFASRHRIDNRVQDVAITGEGSTGNTELDLSCQQGTTVSHVTIDGNGIDIYICHGVTVTDARLVGRAAVGLPYTWVMNDSSDIALRHIVTVGSGGVIVRHLGDLPCTEVTVTDETMETPTATLLVGDVDGLAIVDSVVGVLKVAPAVSARVLAVRGSSIEHPVACPHPGRVRGLHGLRCGSPVPGPRR